MAVRGPQNDVPKCLACKFFTLWVVDSGLGHMPIENVAPFIHKITIYGPRRQINPQISQNDPLSQRQPLSATQTDFPTPLSLSVRFMRSKEVSHTGG